MLWWRVWRMTPVQEDPGGGLGGEIGAQAVPGAVGGGKRTGSLSRATAFLTIRATDWPVRRACTSGSVGVPSRPCRVTGRNAGESTAVRRGGAGGGGHRGLPFAPGPDRAGVGGVSVGDAEVPGRRRRQRSAPGVTVGCTSGRSADIGRRAPACSAVLKILNLDDALAHAASVREALVRTDEAAGGLERPSTPGLRHLTD